MPLVEFVSKTTEFERTNTYHALDCAVSVIEKNHEYDTNVRKNNYI
jgi:hypothetical protein